MGTRAPPQAPHPRPTPRAQGLSRSWTCCVTPGRWLSLSGLTSSVSLMGTVVWRKSVGRTALQWMCIAVTFAGEAESGDQAHAQATPPGQGERLRWLAGRSMGPSPAPLIGALLRVQAHPGCHCRTGFWRPPGAWVQLVNKQEPQSQLWPHHSQNEGQGRHGRGAGARRHAAGTGRARGAAGSRGLTTASGAGSKASSRLHSACGGLGLSPGLAVLTKPLVTAGEVQTRSLSQHIRCMSAVVVWGHSDVCKRSRGPLPEVARPPGGETPPTSYHPVNATWKLTEEKRQPRVTFLE